MSRTMRFGEEKGGLANAIVLARCYCSVFVVSRLASSGDRFWDISEFVLAVLAADCFVSGPAGTILIKGQCVPSVQTVTSTEWTREPLVAVTFALKKPLEFPLKVSNT